MSDSDDDKPIIALIKKRVKDIKPEVKSEKNEEKSSKKPRTEEATNSKVKHEVKKEKENRTEKSAKSKSGSSSGSGSTSLARRTMDFYEDTDKGLLVQRLLVRWWYAIEWPIKEEIGTAPEGYESLEGFPGVFISTKSESLGTILDLRNKANCPNLRNLSAWSARDLQEKVITAYEKQMEVLEQMEGAESKLYRQLKAELREVRKVDCDKADREARNFHL
eukprot:gene43646-53376_t